MGGAGQGLQVTWHRARSWRGQGYPVRERAESDFARGSLMRMLCPVHAQAQPVSGLQCRPEGRRLGPAEMTFREHRSEARCADTACRSQTKPMAGHAPRVCQAS